MSETGKVYQIQYPTTVSGKVYNVRDVSGEQNVTGKVYQVASVNGGGGTTIRNQDKQITENGTYTADAGYTGLGTVTVNVPSGGGSASKYGVTIDNLIGNLDSDGALLPPDNADSIVLQAEYIFEQSGLAYGFAAKPIGYIAIDVPYLQDKALNYTFIENPILDKVDIVNLRYIGSNALQYTFRNCKTLKKVEFQAAESSSGGRVEVNTDSNFMNYTFHNCSALEYALMGAFTKMAGTTKVFYGCTSLMVVELPILETISGTQSHLFYGCTGLHELRFPSLTSITSSGFGTSSSNYAFQGCTGLVEIHFRADMQATIEAMSGYSAKWGATNATIFFDL